MFDIPLIDWNGNGEIDYSDIAQTLADLKPSFIRWPGGCIVEGMSMENRIKWKETIGDRLNGVAVTIEVKEPEVEGDVETD